jgi:hypothetical protein
VKMGRSALDPGSVGRRVPTQQCRLGVGHRDPHMRGRFDLGAACAGWMKQGTGSTGPTAVLGRQIWQLEAEVRRCPIEMTSDGGGRPVGAARRPLVAHCGGWIKRKKRGLGLGKES